MACLCVIKILVKNRSFSVDYKISYVQRKCKISKGNWNKRLKSVQMSSYWFYDEAPLVINVMTVVVDDCMAGAVTLVLHVFISILFPRMPVLGFLLTRKTSAPGSSGYAFFRIQTKSYTKRLYNWHSSHTEILKTWTVHCQGVWVSCSPWITISEQKAFLSHRSFPCY